MARSESRQKTKLIQVRATPEEKLRLQARAAAFGISMGELVRETLFGSAPKSKTDQLAIQEVVLTRADLGRLGGLLRGWLGGDAFEGAPMFDPVYVRKLLQKIETDEKIVIESVKRLAGKT